MPEILWEFRARSKLDRIWCRSREKGGQRHLVFGFVVSFCQSARRHFCGPWLGGGHFCRGLSLRVISCSVYITFVCEFRRKGKIKGRERETWSVVRNTLVDTVACPLLIPAKSSLTMQTIILGDNTNVDLLFSEICQRSSILLYPRRSRAVP